MRAVIAIAVVFGAGSAACAGAPPPPPANMPLPPGRAELEGARAPAGDGRLRVLGITPDRGPAAGRGAVRIRGANFRNAAKVEVKFGSTLADVLRITDDEIDVQAPPGSGVVDVTVVFEPGGELKLPAAYTYNGLR